MTKVVLKIFALFFLFIFIVSGISTSGLSNKFAEEQPVKSDGVVCSDNFYFIQITDTHIINKLFDKKQTTKERFESVLNEIRSFDKKPAFIVITGDLVEWGGFGIVGALNYKEFVDCLYEKDSQLYLNSECTIPVYTTPGNHDYRWSTKLTNYHRFIDKNHVESNDRYVIKYENLSLFFLDSGHDYLLNPLGWVRLDGLHVKGSGLYDDDIVWLNNSLNESNSRYKIVLMHHPAIDKLDNFGNMLDVISQNRLEFIETCEYHNVELVLTGHTHRDAIFDGDENFYYDNTSLNCSLYPTLFVQTDDCKEGVHYRNVSVIGNDIWMENCVEVEGADSSMNFNLQGADVRFEHLNWELQK